MYWFKNVMLYRITKTLDWNVDALQQQLSEQKFNPCGSYDTTKFGWVNPLADSELYYYAAGKQILLIAQKEDKIMPSQVIKRELMLKITEQEEKEQRKLKKTEKQTMQDEVINTLLPRAFSKFQQTLIWIDVEHDLIYVDAASTNRAEAVLGLLRKSLGSLPVVPFSFAQDISQTTTSWLINDSLPNWLELLNEAELKAGDVSGIIRCKQQELQDEEITNHLKAGKFITKLALEWPEHMSFVLTEDGSLKRLKFAPAISDANDDTSKEDRLAADFYLMSQELQLLTMKLLNEFGGEQID